MPSQGSVPSSAAADDILNVGGKMSQILLACLDGVRSYTDLKGMINISDTALSRNLDVLQHKGFLMKVSGGYMTTREGEVVAHQVRLASESTRHKLARKLVILQKLVEPKEILRFEVVRALGDPPLTMRKYLALAIASSLEVAYLNPEMLAKDELNLYEQALDTVRALLHSKSQKTAGLIIRFNLEEGYNAVLHMLLEEIDLEKDAHRKTILVDILKKMQDPSNREALMREAIDRFVIR